MSVGTDPRIGTHLGGYLIEGLIGHGGMGVVYRAKQVRLDRVVALKILAPHLSDDPGFQERFEREWQVAASIDHPNIVPIYEAGEIDGLLFIAMRYVDGTDLGQLLTERGRLEPALAASIVSQIGSALQAAHAKGLVHRDIKPANILLGPSHDDETAYHVYLTDFGIAKRWASRAGLTGTGFFVGTLHYAAPEQIEARPLDGRIDVYALGVVLYQCLTGVLPYERDSEVAVMFAKLTEPPQSARALRQDLPPEIDPVLDRAMAKAADDRYGTPRELVSAMRAALKISQAGTPSPAAAPTERAREAPILPGAAAAATLAAQTEPLGAPETAEATASAEAAAAETLQGEAAPATELEQPTVEPTERPVTETPAPAADDLAELGPGATDDLTETLDEDRSAAETVLEDAEEREEAVETDAAATVAAVEGGAGPAAPTVAVTPAEPEVTAAVPPVAEPPIRGRPPERPPPTPARPRRRWMLVAGLAAVLLVIGGAAAAIFALGGKDEGAGGTSAAAGTTAPDGGATTEPPPTSPGTTEQPEQEPTAEPTPPPEPQPTKAEQKLIAFAPAGLRDSCTPREPSVAQARAEVRCADGTVNARYLLFPTAKALSAQYATIAPNLARNEGTCGPDELWAENEYTNRQGVVAGRLLCYVAGGRSRIAWTEDKALIFANAYRTDTPGIVPLLEWWEKPGRKQAVDAPPPSQPQDNQPPEQAPEPPPTTIIQG